jgi:hypothetical protein
MQGRHLTLIPAALLSASPPCTWPFAVSWSTAWSDLPTSTTGTVNGVSAQPRSPKLKFSAQRCKDPEHGQDTPCTMGFPQAFHSHNGMKIS